MEILFEDDSLIVCVKEAGVPVQSSRIGVKDLASILKNYRKETEGLEGEPYLGLIHRLDQPVQGVMAFAKTREAAAGLSAQVREGAMEKEYLAVIQSGSPGPGGTLVDYLQKDGRTNTSRVVSGKAPGAKQARLEYRILSQKEGFALAAIRLYTGRHHQIRVQMAHGGMPLAGDRKYGPESPDGSRAGLALCAHRLTLRHPGTKEKMVFETNPIGGFFEIFGM